jgi:cyanoexosortase B-associated protein
MVFLPKFEPSQTIKLLIVLFVLAIAAVPILPNYVTQNWAWSHLPKVATLSQLRTVQQQGLTLPDWQTLDHQVVEIGGKKWSVQTLQANASSPELQKPVTLMLRLQNWQLDQPEVEWMDVKEWMDNREMQQWRTDMQQRLHFVVNPSSESSSLSNKSSAVAVEARFLRGWSQKQTYAVLQWYAWTTAGSPAISRWFWADQFSQWRDRQRMPWVAVSVLIPIQPLGEIEPMRSLAATLGQDIQSALLEDALKPNT